MSNTNFTDQNLEFHRRWLELEASEEQDSRKVIQGKRNLGNDVIQGNRRMIGAEIRKYTVHSPELEHDLFDTAAAELWRAFQKWDPERGTLRTAAMPYIKGAVRREMVRHDHPHLTYDDFTMRNKAVQARREFELAHDRSPSVEELSKITGITESKVRVLFSGNPVSLDQPVAGADSDDMTLESVIAEQEDATGAGSVEEFAAMNSQLEDEAVANADPVALMAYLMRQPSDGGHGARTAEIAYMLGIPTIREVSNQVNEFAMLNAYTKLRRVLGEDPTIEQLSILAGTRETVSKRFLQEMDILRTQRHLRGYLDDEPTAEQVAEASGHDTSLVVSVLNAH